MIHLKGIYYSTTIMSEQTRYSLVEISVKFIKSRPTFVFELVLQVEAGFKHKSGKFKPEDGDLVRWYPDTFVCSSLRLGIIFLIPYSHFIVNSCATLTIQRVFFETSVAQIIIEFKPNELGDYSTVELEG